MRSSRKLLIAVAAAAGLQALLWLLASQGQITAGFAVAATLASAWGLIAILVVAASRHAERLSGELNVRQTEHQATLDQVEQLEALNEMLVTLGRTKDAGLAFQGLARRIGRLVPGAGRRAHPAGRHRVRRLRGQHRPAHVPAVRTGHGPDPSAAGADRAHHR